MLDRLMALHPEVSYLQSPEKPFDWDVLKPDKPERPSQLDPAKLIQDTSKPDPSKPSQGTPKPDQDTPAQGTPKPDPATPTQGTPKPDPATPTQGTPKPDPATPTQDTPKPDPVAPGSADLIRELANARRNPTPYVDKLIKSDPAQLPTVAGSYLAQELALNEALLWQASPESQLLGLVSTDAERSEVSLELLRTRLGWQDSPDAHLIDLLDSGDQKAIAKELLRARAGIPESDALAAQRVAFETARVGLFQQAVAAAAEYVEQRKRWRAISKWSVGILIGSLAVSLLLTLRVVELVGAKSIDGWQGVAIIFVLAVVAVSPAVLLLLERPLAGIDAFQPAGPAKAESSAAAAEPATGDDTKTKKT